MSWPEKPTDSGRVTDRASAERSSATGTANESLREQIRAIVEESRTPITVSKLADRLHASDDESEYGDVHEALYRDHLQNLDAEGALVFDMELGLVFSAEAFGEMSVDGYTVG